MPLNEKARFNRRKLMAGTTGAVERAAARRM